jgi:hypothetical protein
VEEPKSSSQPEVDSIEVARTQPHAMIDDLDQVFYPDNDEDAAEFAREHGARLLSDVPLVPSTVHNLHNQQRMIT